MEKTKKMSWAFLFMALFLILIPLGANAEMKDFLLKFQPSITVEEEYNNNIFLTPNNKIDDFITTIYPALRFSTKGRSEEMGQFREAPTTAEKNYGVDLNVRAGFSFYADNQDENYISVDGTLNAWYTWANRLTFRVRDVVTRSNDIKEEDYSISAIPGQVLVTTTKQNVIWFRNVVEPSMDYQFGREDHLSILYRNNVYEVDSQFYEDSMENFVNPKLMYWFNLHHGISLEYGFTSGQFEWSSDYISHMGTGRYTYRFNPRTSIFGEYHQEWYDFDHPTIDQPNSIVYRPSLGIEHAFSPTLNLRIQGGYYWYVPDEGETKDGVYYDVSLVQRSRRTTYSLGFLGGYTQDFFSSDNQGFIQSHRAVGTISHQLFEKLILGASGYGEYLKYRDDREDKVFGVNANISYRPFRWLILGLEGSYRAGDSNVDVNDYSEVRGIFRITATF